MLDVLQNFINTNKDLRSFLRAKAGYYGLHGNYLPIQIVIGFHGPKLVGKSSYWTTPSGKTKIVYPNAYKWPKLYHHSTLRIEVSQNWLKRVKRRLYQEAIVRSLIEG